MKNVIRHIKKHVIRGLFVIIPIALSYFAVLGFVFQLRIMKAEPK
jgi:hypothetical protein